MISSYADDMRGFAAGERGPREALEGAISRSRDHGADVRAFGTLDLTAARTAVDIPTACGGGMVRDRRTGRDGEVVRRLRDVGAILIGKTVTTQFAIGRSGPTRDPHDLEGTPGASPSGSAVAIDLIGKDCGLILHAMACMTGKAAMEQEFPIAAKPLLTLHLTGWHEVDAEDAAIFENYLEDLSAAGIVLLDRTSDLPIGALEDVLDRGVASSFDMIAYDMRDPFARYAEDFPDGLLAGNDRR